MGWKARPKTTMRWEQPAALDRIRASAGEPGGRGLSPEKERMIRTSVINRAVQEGLIDASEREAFERYGSADLWGLVDALNEREAARRAGGNGSLAAGAARCDDAERLLASAEAEGRFPRSRRAFWRERLRADPERTRVLLTARPHQGGLTPVLTAAKSPPLVDQERVDHERGFAAAFPGPARTLGYAMDRRPGRITDRS